MPNNVRTFNDNERKKIDLSNVRIIKKNLLYLIGLP